MKHLTDLSLLSRVGDGLWVHRWTAQGLRHAEPDGWAARFAQAGRYRVARLTSSKALDDAVEATRNYLDAEAWDEAVSIGDTVAQHLQNNSLLSLATFAGEVAAALPTDHSDNWRYPDFEAQGIIASGGSTRAVATYQRIVEEHQARLEAEPGRADYQRDLLHLLQQTRGFVPGVWGKAFP